VLHYKFICSFALIYKIHLNKERHLIINSDSVAWTIQHLKLSDHNHGRLAIE